MIPAPKPIKISGSEFVLIAIPKKSYEFLSQWASVSRTLTRAKEHLEELATMDLNEGFLEETNHNLEELLSLIRPLDDVNNSCKQARFAKEILDNKSK
jgi:hypothetical protein